MRYFLIVILSFYYSALLAAGSLNTASFSVNQNPLISIFGLPDVYNAVILSENSSQVSSVLNWSNIYYQSPPTLQNESLVVDSETQQLDLIFTTSIGVNSELGLSVPLINISAGGLDRFINNWHETFNFADFGRSDGAINELLISFEQDSNNQLLLSSPSNGLGDIDVFYGLQILNKNRYPYQKMALRINWNLPTGEVKDLLGSGTNDISVWFDFSQHQQVFNQALRVNLSVGLLTIIDDGLLSNYINRNIGFARSSVDWMMDEKWDLVAHLKLHSAFYKSTDIKALNSAGVEAALGFSYHFEKESYINVGLIEDINVGVSPDITFYFAYSQMFSR